MFSRIVLLCVSLLALISCSKKNSNKELKTPLQTNQTLIQSGNLWLYVAPKLSPVPKDEVYELNTILTKSQLLNFIIDLESNKYHSLVEISRSLEEKEGNSDTEYLLVQLRTKFAEKQMSETKLLTLLHQEIRSPFHTINVMCVENDKSNKLGYLVKKLADSNLESIKELFKKSSVPNLEFMSSIPIDFFRISGLPTKEHDIQKNIKVKDTLYSLDYAIEDNTVCRLFNKKIGLICIFRKEDCEYLIETSNMTEDEQKLFRKQFYNDLFPDYCLDRRLLFYSIQTTKDFETHHSGSWNP